MIYLTHSHELSQEELTDRKYAFPEERKYPMPDKKHVLSAIKFFNYISPEKEKELAKEIIKRIKEYGITDINIGKNNRFLKYYNEYNTLSHYCILGQKWGKKNGPPYYII